MEILTILFPEFVELGKWKVSNTQNTLFINSFMLWYAHKSKGCLSSISILLHHSRRYKNRHVDNAVETYCILINDKFDQETCMRVRLPCPGAVGQEFNDVLSGCPVGLPVSPGHVSTDYEVTSAANGRTMILTRETRACNPSLTTRVLWGTVIGVPLAFQTSNKSECVTANIL